MNLKGCAKYFIFAVVALVVVIWAGIWVWSGIWLVNAFALDNKLQTPAVYEPVAKTLILYCQSDQKLFPSMINSDWYPAKLREVTSEGRVFVGTTEAEIWWPGGGLHPLRYKLELDRSASTPQTNVWQLFIWTGRSRETLLCTKSVPITQRLSAANLLERLIPVYDEQIAERLASKDEDDDLNERPYKKKIQLLLRFGKNADARKTCKDMVEKLPADWWANLVWALILAKEDLKQKS